MQYKTIGLKLVQKFASIHIKYVFFLLCVFLVVCLFLPFSVKVRALNHLYKNDVKSSGEQ